MEYNKNENAEIAFSRLDQEELVPKHAEKRNLTDSLEAKNRNLSAYIAAQETEDAEKSDLIDSLKAKIRKLSATIAVLRKETDAGDAWTDHLGQSYYFSTRRLSWTESRDYCATVGAQLVIIKSEETQDFLVGNIEETHWIGLSDIGTEGKWHWVDDTPLSPTEKQFWHQRDYGDHEPDNWYGDGDPNGEDCAAMGNESWFLQDWFDATCWKRKKFICEK